MFESPEMLVFLLVVPLMLALFWARERARVRAVKRIGDAMLVARLATQVSPARRRWKSALWLGALVALVIALARPVWGTAAEIIEARGVAVIVALDVSVSMDAQDIAPSRLERAKLTLREVMDNSGGDLFALVLFAGDAFVQFPLTSDLDTAKTFVEAASSLSITRQGTAIADALTLAQTVYDSRLAQQGVLILMSDGENHEGDPIAAARLARENGLTVHVVGYGTPDGDVIPVFNADSTVTYKTDRASQIVITRLDEAVLQAIAEAGGGTYRRAESSGIDAVELANVIAQVEADTLQAQQLTRGVERFGVFVLVAVMLLSIEMLMGERRPENEAQR